MLANYLYLDYLINNCAKKILKKQTKKKHKVKRNMNIDLRGSLNKFQDFFRMCTFIDSKVSKVVSL